MKGRIDSVSKFNTFRIHRLPESGFCTDATEEDIRQGQRQLIKMGLMRYLAKTPLFKDFNISFNKNEESKPVEDKWKSWVFNIQINTYLNAEESTKASDFYTSIGINKITKNWKLTFSFGNDYMNQIYKYDSETIKSISRSSYFYNMIAKSLNDHWSAGYFFDMSNTTYMNVDLGYAIAPAIEYDLFPYTKSIRKILTFLYRIGYQYYDYIDTSLYLKTSE